MLRIKLDGKLIPLGEHSDIRDGQIVIRRKNEAGQPRISFSESITFYGEAYRYMKAKFIDNDNAVNEVVKIEVYNSCCSTEIIYTGKFIASRTKWCSYENGAPRCSIEAESTEFTTDSEFREKLKGARIAANHNGFFDRPHPFVRHCVELRPSFLQDVIVIVGILISFLLRMLTLIVVLFNVVKEIIDAIGALFSGQKVDWDNDVWVQFQEFKQKLMGFIIGCGRGHISPYIRDYANNAAVQVGLTGFRSSIFNDPLSQYGQYFNAVWFYAPYNKGSFDYDGAARRKYFGINFPPENGAQFMDRLCEIFNAEWWIQDNFLVLEPKSTETAVMFDFTIEPLKSRVQNICSDVPEGYLPAYARFEYAQDATDWAGNEAKLEYDDLVDFGTPPAPNRRGDKLVQLPIGRIRWRNDGIDRDVISTYDNIPLINTLVRNDWDRYMLLPMHIAGSPKIIVVEPDSAGFTPIGSTPAYTGVNFSAVRKSIGGGNYRYNIPMWFCAGADGSVTIDKVFEPNNLYTNFWRKDDPRFNPTVLNRTFSIEFIYNCADLVALQKLNTNSVVIFNDYNRKLTGVVTEITFNDKTVTIKGTV